MKNKTIKLLSSVLVATMLTTAGCGAESAATAEPAAESKEEAVAESAEPAAAEEAAAEEDGYAYEKNTDPATVSIYIDSPGTWWETWGSDPVSQRVTDLTGISFECVAPVTDDDTKLTLLISSDDLPDIVTAGASDPAWETMVSNGMLADLEELAAQYAPKLLTELVDDEVWEFCREEDGKVYSLISCYNTSETLEWLEKYYQKFEETSDMSGLMEEYNQMLVNRGSEVCVLDPCGEYRGKALGINDAGELRVEKEDGTTENVYAGEVSVRGVYGYV